MVMIVMVLGVPSAILVLLSATMTWRTSSSIPAETRVLLHRIIRTFRIPLGRTMFKRRISATLTPP